MSSTHASSIPLSRFSWGISDGAAGHGSQVRGLCEALGGNTTLFDCKLRSPWHLLPASIVPKSRMVLPPRPEFHQPMPTVVVSCGRQAATTSVVLRSQWPSNVYSIHLQNPQTNLSRFDLVIAPEHDGLQGDNVIVTRGALHPLSPAVLNKVAEKGPIGGLEQLRKEFVAVILGGPNRYYPFSLEDMSRLADKLQKLTAAGHQLAIIPSRRTPAKAVELFQRQFADQHLVWTGGENPYRSALALASHLIVTGDSISMISEANATGRPVYVEMLQERRPAKKFQRFHQLCIERNLIRPFTGRLDSWSYEPLFEAGRVAEIVQARLGHAFPRVMAPAA